MSVRCLAIGDPHIRKDNIEDSEIMIKKIVDQVKLLDPDFVVNLGDTLHYHETMNQTSRTLAVNKFILEIAKIKPIFIIIGNHDRINHTDFMSEYHPFPGEKGLKNVYIIENTQVHYIMGKKFVFVPYVFPGRFKEALFTCIKEEELLDQSITCCFAHQEFHGASFGGGEKSNIGDLWDVRYPYVVSGHIHQYQLLDDGILYIGTPRHQEHGDNTKKTISLLTYTDEREPIEERIDLGMRKKKTFKICATNISNDIKLPEGFILRVVVYGTKSENDAAKLHPKIIELEKELGKPIVYKEIDDKLTVSIRSTFYEESFSTTLLNQCRRDRRKMKFLKNSKNINTELKL